MTTDVGRIDYASARLTEAWTYTTIALCALRDAERNLEAVGYDTRRVREEIRRIIAELEMAWTDDARAELDALEADVAEDMRREDGDDRF